MPICKPSSYKAPAYFSNRHFQTIYPSLYRKVMGINYVRERLELDDGDFLDLDFSRIDSNKIVIVLHGLEGSADRPYVQGMIKLFNENGWDGVGINFRGCSGTPNRLAKTYHSGETGDLNAVINKISNTGKYVKIALIGFSLGGNVCLKYVGEQGKNLNHLIKKAVAFSVPCHLESASYALSKWYNSIYMSRFMIGLKEKIKSREKILKDKVILDNVYRSKSFLDFDENFTAPVFGFKNALDYWTQSSSKQFLENIRIPTLLVNAKNDTFLSPECYPEVAAKKSKYFFLETPAKGGHVGFGNNGPNGYYWSERRALQFVLNEH